MAIDEKLRTLNRNEIVVLYWLCKGLKYDQIALRTKYSKHWVQLQMSTAYQKLGFNKNMHWTERRGILEHEVCPRMPKNIDGWRPEEIKPTEEPPPEPNAFDNEIMALVVYDEKMLVAKEKETIVVKPTNRTGTAVAVIGGFSLLTIFIVFILGFGLGAYFFGRKTNTPPVVATNPVVNPTMLPEASLVPIEPSETPFPPFIPPADGILFQDNFDNGIDPAWKIANGQWVTVDGKLTVIDDKNSNFKWIQLEAPNWPNYRINYFTKLTGGNVVIGVRNQSIGFKSGYGPDTCWTYITVDLSGSDCISQGVYWNGSTADIEIDAVNNKYSAKLNGVPIQEVTSDGLSGGGVSVGIYCPARSQQCSYIDNLVVTYLP